MTNLVPFSFESHKVRVLTDDNGEPLFVAKDVAEALGYKDPTTAVKSHCRGVQELHPIPDALGRMQEARVIREPDLYRLIFGSTLDSAQAFERLVVEEILPTIRKTGRYAAPSAVPQPIPATIDFEGTTLRVIERDGAPWLAASTLAAALGEGLHLVQNTFHRNRGQFAGMSAVIRDGRTPQVRIFSVWGVYLLCLLIHTPRAARLREWTRTVLDTLGALGGSRLPPPAGAGVEIQLRALVTLRDGVLVGIAPLPEPAPVALASPTILGEVIDRFAPARAAATRYHYPAELAKPDRRSADGMINSSAWLNQIGSPLGDLLRQLKADGHDVNGALIQFHALRGILLSSTQMWRAFRSQASAALDQSLPWTPALPDTLWALTDW